MLTISARSYARQMLTRRALSTASALRAPHHQGPNKDTNAFNTREKASEDMYVRDHEKQKLKELQKSIEASKQHLSKLESDAKALESSISQGGTTKKD
ncbi:ATPase inhibitor [Microbotryomycetes sp. JL221]|nr:ATPase inhibitor [Microbotryomycetes sp. JL221]